MKIQKLLLTLILILSCLFAYSQDVITLKTGEDIKCKVTEVGTAEVKYKKVNSDDAPNYVVAKTEIFSITYKDGTKDVMNSQPAKQPQPVVATTNTPPSPAPPAPKITANSDSLYKLGVKDAKINYKKYSGATLGTFVVTSLTSPLIGLIPAIACSSTTPSDKRLGIPNTPYKDNADYIKGYKSKAKRMKGSRTWIEYGLGVVTCVALTVLITSASAGH